MYHFITHSKYAGACIKQLEQKWALVAIEPPIPPTSSTSLPAISVKEIQMLHGWMTLTIVG